MAEIDVSVDQAIHFIQLAADEISPDDFITFLTPLDLHLSYALDYYNISDQTKLLEALSQILEAKSELTANIAWDLIGSLVPFTDVTLRSDTVDSDVLLVKVEACISSLSKYGNPREVVLKATEVLRSGVDDGNIHIKMRLLLKCLATVFTRIKTKYPSRFLAAILPAIHMTCAQVFPRFGDEDNLATAKVVIEFIEAVQPQKTKPALPPRQQSSGAPITHLPATIIRTEAVPDPEASSAELVPAEGDNELQTKLLQSLHTHVLAEYSSSFTNGPANLQDAMIFADDKDSSHRSHDSEGEEDDGLSLSLLLYSQYHPEHAMPGTSFEELSKASPILKMRFSAIAAFLQSAARLSITPEILADALLAPEPIEEEGIDEDNDDLPPPSDPSDIPLSRSGCAILLAAWALKGQPWRSLPNFPPKLMEKGSLYPMHSSIMKAILADHDGKIPSSVLDAILALGVCIAAQSSAGLVDGESEAYESYLQTLLAIAMRDPSPRHRFFSHNLATSTYHAHPDQSIRLQFLIKLLGNSEYPQLKECTVGWYKTELLAHSELSESTFATPDTFSRLVPFLFPAIAVDSHQEDWADNFASVAGFRIATLNLLYLLLRRSDLSQQMSLQQALEESDVLHSYIEPLQREAQLLSMNETEQPDGDVSMSLVILHSIDNVQSLFSS